MDKKTKITVTVITVSVLVVASIGIYVVFFMPHAALPNNYEVNTSFNLGSGKTVDLVNFNLTEGGSLWVNYTSATAVTVYVLNASQMSSFNPGSSVSAYFSPGVNLTHFNQSSPVDLTPGYYHVVFYNPGLSSAQVEAANISWNPVARL